MVKKVLIIDDEEDVCISVKMFVEGLGFSAETAGSGKEGITLLKKKKFDLVLLDMLMPEMNGKETLEKIRADPKIKNQKVAFLTVVSLIQAGKKDIEKLKPVDYIVKPVDAKIFKEKLLKLLK